MSKEEHTLQEIVVCASVTADWSMQLAVMLRSIQENVNPRTKVKAIIFHFGIPESLQKRVEKSLATQIIQIVWKKVELDFLKDFHSLNPIFPKESYVRLALGELLPHEPKVIWLDADLVVTNDLTKLWRTSLKAFPLAAAPCVSPKFVTYGGATGCANQHVLNLEAPAFNAGVLLIDLEQWRKLNFWELACNEIRAHQKFHYCADQDVLNTLFHSNWHVLEQKWNVQNGIVRYPWFNLSRTSLFQWLSLVLKPSLIHFNSRHARPWNLKTTTRFQKRYFSYLDLTDWKDWRPKE